MDKINEILTSGKLWYSLIILALSFLFFIIIKHLTNKVVAKAEQNDKAKANIRLISNIIKTAVFVLALLTVLQINGINITSYLTGLGVAGIIVGFALQDILKDLITGANILFDNYFSIGDVVKYKNTYGKVLSLTMRATKIKDIETEDIITISNRNITEISKISNRFTVNVPVPYTIKNEKAIKICEEITENIAMQKSITKCVFSGADSLDASYITYKLYVYGKPENRVINNRIANSIILETFAKNKIQVPFNQLDVHIDK